MSNAELRSEYSRLRAIANKRIGRREAAGFDYDLHSYFPKVKDLSHGEMEKQLANVSYFLNSDRTTLRGYRDFVKRDLERLHSEGYHFITEKNITDFYKFMDRVRVTVGENVFDSGDAADVYTQGERLNIPEDVLETKFLEFVNDMDKMEKVKPIKTDKRITYSVMKRKMDRVKIKKDEDEENI